MKQANQLGLMKEGSSEAKQKITEAEENRLLVELIKDYAIFFLDPNGIVTRWDIGAELMNHYKPEEIIGKSFRMFYTDEDVQNGWPEHNLRQAIEHGRYEEIRERLKKGQEPFWADVAILPLRDQEDDLIGFAKIIKDVSAQRRAQEELRKWARQQEILVQLGLEVLAGKDSGSIMDQLVPLIEEALDVPYVKVIERVAHTTHNDLLMRAVGGFDPALAGLIFEPGDEPHAAYTLQARKPVIVEDINTDPRIQPSPLHRQYGLVSGVCVVIYGPTEPFGILQVDTDYKRLFTRNEINFLQALANGLGNMLEQKEAELALLAYQNQLEQSNKDLEQFALMTSHDLQAPLRKIQTFSDMVLQHEKENTKPETADLLRRIHRAAETSQLFINDMLELAQVTHNTKPFEQVELSEVMDRVLVNLSDPIREKNAHIETKTFARVTGDPMQLEQLLQNLVENSLKYQPKGQIPDIHVEADCSEHQCELVLTDNGIGFEPANAERIFEPFTRLHGKGSEYTGTGVGLSICKRIVERHGGTIKAESTPGEGSRFTIRLPR